MMCRSSGLIVLRRLLPIQVDGVKTTPLGVGTCAEATIF